ncbi:MAG: type II toxin-antitoxin system HipA family toxin [Rhodospirillales bacterium]|nr:type II toxin-antitoxin system HipA family toxin [Rhodospirillales bacterium]
MPDVSVLEVLLHGVPIGTITRFADDRTLFAFNKDYIEDAQRPTLGLGFKDAHGQLITEQRPTHVKLLPYFSNLLPEGHMRTYLAQRADIHPAREFFLLWMLGKDLPGAISIRPADGHAWPPAEDRGDGADEDDHDGRRRENALRFSLTGVQLKFSAVSEATGGLTIPAKGVGGSWIVKLPSRGFESVAENEFSMMTLAGKIGMNVPPIRLIDPASIRNLPEGLGTLKGQALAIERFDRLEGDAVHIEDFAQVFGAYPDDKYGKASYRNLATVIGAEASHADVEEFISRLVFNALIGNADMHLKNWSLIYPDRRRAALAPAYDFVSTIAYIPDANAALKFSRTRRFDELTLEELSRLADKALLPQKLVLDAAAKTVALFHENWAKEKKNLPMPDAVVKAIEEHSRTIPLARS